MSVVRSLSLEGATSRDKHYLEQHAVTSLKSAPLEAKCSFERQLSTASTEATPSLSFTRCSSSAPYEDSPIFQELPISRPPPTVESLEELVHEVKDLYSQKFGSNVEVESEVDEPTTRSGVLPTVGLLETLLHEVKDLYSLKFGCDVDVESDAGEAEEPDEETMARNCPPHIVESSGSPPTVGSYIVESFGPPPTVGSLETLLHEVKDLYSQRFGRDVDVESEIDEATEPNEEATNRNCPPPTVESLEELLHDVKDLYFQKFGDDVDRKSDVVEATMRSCPPPMVGSLETLLHEVKDLYSLKFGCDVDAESNVDEAEEPDEKTMAKSCPPYIVERFGSPPTVGLLETLLHEVRDLYTQRFGHDVDGESEVDEATE